MAYTYSKIATYTVGSGGVATISFINIPQTYTDLNLFLSLRDTRGAAANDFSIEFNNSTSNRTYRVLKGDGTSAVSFSGSTALIAVEPGNTATSNTFGNTQIYIPNYTSSNYKSISSDSVTENNATAAEAWLTASLWSNTAPITSITIRPGETGSPTFMQYSSAHLYGIKAEL